MNRLLVIKQNFVSESRANLDSEELKTLIFGLNHPQRSYAFDVIRNKKMMNHYHITEDNKQEVRKQTLMNVFISRDNYKGSLDKTISDPNPLSLYSNGLVFNDLGASIRAGVHAFLYAKSIMHLGTQKHQSLFERAHKYADIGCFALTELNHGSNVKGILTEAHYDHQNKQFIIHTPTKEAMKFWIGGAAQTANKAVVWAQLYIGQRCYGVHAYVIPIRDLNTHKLLPGVLIGDCGPKNGLNGIDNGFIIFDKVRIPKDYQLNRISGVNQQGQFQTIVQNDEKRFGLHLAALSGGRFFIANNCCGISLAALTIAIRYCSEKRFYKAQNHPSYKVLLDYAFVKRRLMPLFAQNIVYYITSMKAIFEWDINQKNILDPKHPMIEQLHAISSVLKAKTSWYTSQCIHECREILGANGYSSYSKLSVLFNDNDVNHTWEGDNHVLIQQTSKYVLEQAQKVLQKGKETNNPLLSFLSNAPSQLSKINAQNLLDLEKGLYFLQFKMIRKIEETSMKMLQLYQQKLSTIQVYLGRQVADAYGDLSLLTTMRQTISKCKNHSNQQLLINVTRLWLLSVYLKDELIQLTHHPLIETLIGQQSDNLAARSLQILKIISTDDDVIGSPFADPNGNGIQKYLQLIMNKPTNPRPAWWQMIVNR